MGFVDSNPIARSCCHRRVPEAGLLKCEDRNHLLAVGFVFSGGTSVGVRSEGGCQSVSPQHTQGIVTGLEEPCSGGQQVLAKQQRARQHYSDWAAPSHTHNTFIGITSLALHGSVMEHQAWILGPGF